MPDVMMPMVVPVMMMMRLGKGRIGKEERHGNEGCNVNFSHGIAPGTTVRGRQYRIAFSSKVSCSPHFPAKCLRDVLAARPSGRSDGAMAMESSARRTIGVAIPAQPPFPDCYWRRARMKAVTTDAELSAASCMKVLIWLVLASPPARSAPSTTWRCRS